MMIIFSRRRAQKVATFNFSDYITKLLSDSSNNINQNMDDYLCAVICLPHIRPLCTNTDLLRIVLKNLLNIMRPYVAGTGNGVDAGDTSPGTGVRTPYSTESETVSSTSIQKACNGEGKYVSGGDTVASRVVARKLADKEDYITAKAKRSCIIEDRTNQENFLFLLSFAVEMVVHLTDEESLRKVCGLEDLLEVILPLAATGNISALRSIDLYLTAHTVDAINMEEKEATFKKLYSHLHRLLTSPFHKVFIICLVTCSSLYCATM